MIPPGLYIPVQELWARVETRRAMARQTSGWSANYSPCIKSTSHQAIGVPRTQAGLQALSVPDDWSLPAGYPDAASRATTVLGVEHAVSDALAGFAMTLAWSWVSCCSYRHSAD